MTTMTTTAAAAIVLLTLLVLMRSLLVSRHRDDSPPPPSSSSTADLYSLLVPPWQSVVSTNPVISLISSPSCTAATSTTGCCCCRRRWRLESGDGLYGGIEARVPGDLLSDLVRAGIVDEPYFDRNFLTQQEVWVGTPVPANATSAQLRARTRTWIYSTNVTLPPRSDEGENDVAGGTPTFFLVVEEVKMGASIAWDGVPIGVVRNQFLRYILPIPIVDGDGIDAQRLSMNATQGQQRQRHHLTVTFQADTSDDVSATAAIDTDGRYMACSGGWDWAPYSRVGARHRPSFSLGIVQPMYIVQTTSKISGAVAGAAASGVLMTDVVPKIYPICRRGDNNLGGNSNESPCKDFRVQIEIFLQHTESLDTSNVATTATATQSSLTIQSNFSNEVAHIPIVSFSNQTKVTVNMTATNVQLWWPRGGLADQTLYHIDVSFEDYACQKVQKCPTLRKRIGFRTVELVTTANSTSLNSTSEEGSGEDGMYFRVNGVAFWCRGANVVPMDQLEGRLSDEGHELLVESAAKANMNMLRVWGGGAVLPQSFYDACDEHGVLVYHDLMFVEEHDHGAIRTDSVRSEIVGIVRKLAHHPCIVLWSGCNECSYGEGNDNNNKMELYASFVMQTVADADDTRAVWPSSPSPNGWSSGVNTADGKPNGNRLVVQNGTSHRHNLEAHGPYWRGFSDSYPGVNGRLAGNSYETNLPPRFSGNREEGEGFRNTFVSEFGASVSSSFESISATLSPSKWSLHGGSSPDSCHPFVGNFNSCNGTNALAERNYPCDSQIAAFFGDRILSSLDLVGPGAFQMQLYLCMISQTLWMKGQIESMRSTNSYGGLIWQLNENWPTGGWGCIEYGPSRSIKGQVLGGRWKPLMYLLQRHLFQDVIVACGLGDVCYARNDGLSEVDVFVSLQAWSLSRTKPLQEAEWYIHLDPGRSTRYYSLPDGFRKNADVVLVDVTQGSFIDNDSAPPAIRTSAYLWNPPKNISSLTDDVHFNLEVRHGDDEEAIVIEITTHELVLFVVLSTEAVDGQFSDNAFHLRPNQRKVVHFQPVSDDTSNVDVDLFTRTLRIEHLGSHRRGISGFNNQNDAAESRPPTVHFDEKAISKVLE